MKGIKTWEKKGKLWEGVSSLFFIGLTICFLCVIISSSSGAVINIDPSKTTTTTTTEAIEKPLECKHEGINMSKLYMSEHSLGKSQVEESSETGLEPDYWVLNGNITIENGEVVRLFPTGSLWNSVPVDMENWEIQIQVGFNGGKEENGLGFWYTRFMMPPSGSKSRSEGLLILIQRTEHGVSGSAPVSPDHNTENETANSTISVVVNNRTGDNFVDYDWVLSGCSAPLSEKGNQTWLRIRYENHHLSVSTKPEDDDKNEEWVNCFMQKEEEELYLPTSYYFGFSSVLENEEKEDYLDIYQVKTFELIPFHNPECLEDDENTPTPSDEELPMHMPPPVFNQEEIEIEFHGKQRTIEEMVFPFKVLWVPLVGFFIIIAFCVMGMYVYVNEPENLPTRFY